MRCILLSLIPVIFVFCSSSGNKNNNEVGQIIKNWTGKQVVLPDNMEPVLINADGLKPFDEYDRKIVVYIDSTGCTECKLSLMEWKLKIREVNALKSSNRACFIFIINSKDYKLVASYFHKYQFDYPIYFDHDDDFNQINKLPENEKFHVMLLDKNNEVLLIGSPINNEKMWSIYIEQIN